MAGPQRRLILASASPRRAALLAQIGVDFEVLPGNFDESARPGESPQSYVRRMAAGKASVASDHGRPLLAADTVVVLDETVLGKPTSVEHGCELLRRLSGRRHEVMTAVALRSGSRTSEALSVTEVWFRPLSAPEISRYMALGEGLDKAGGYAIQGAGAVFVERIHGSYSGVVGLPLVETHRLLVQADIDIWRT